MNKNKNDSTTTKNQNAVQAPAQSRPTSTSRRKALKTALASGAVITAGSAPTKWVAPVVDSVVLPAHATTSSVQDSWFGTIDSDLIGGTFDQGNPLFASTNNPKSALGKVVGSIADTLIKPANAATFAGQALCVKRTGNANQIAVTLADYWSDDADSVGGVIRFKGTGTLGSTVALSTDCEFGGASEFIYQITFTEQPNGTLEFSKVFSAFGVLTGIISQRPCNIRTGGCPEYIAVQTNALSRQTNRSAVYR